MAREDLVLIANRIREAKSEMAISILALEREDEDAHFGVILDIKEVIAQQTRILDIIVDKITLDTWPICKCGNQATDYSHTCPLKTEIYSDDTKCNCCDTCRSTCEDEV